MSWSRVHIGTNVVAGPPTNHTDVTACGARLFGARLSDDGQLSLSADLYAHRGRHVGTFNGHIWTTAHPYVEMFSAPKRVGFRHRETQVVLLSVWHRDDGLMVTALDLETRDGKRCVLDASGRLAVWTPGPHEPEWQRNRAVQGNVDRIDVATLATETTMRPTVPRHLRAG